MGYALIYSMQRVMRVSLLYGAVLSKYVQTYDIVLQCQDDQV